MSAIDDAWGRNVIDIALLYANHEWYSTEKNVMHGMDPNGRYVDTPDITWHGEVLNCGWWRINQKNVGVPYSWGNASTLEEFDQGIEEGRYAGNVPEDKSRYGSWHTVGVDCSGLLAVCWGLDKKIPAREIPDIAEQIELEEIKQGDVFASKSHVMIFKEFVNNQRTQAVIIDSTRSTGKVSQRMVAIEELEQKGYSIYRKKDDILSDRRYDKR